MAWGWHRRLARLSSGAGLQLEADAATQYLCCGTQSLPGAEGVQLLPGSLDMLHAHAAIRARDWRSETTTPGSVSPLQKREFSSW